MVLRLACALFHPRGAHLGGCFLPRNTRKRPSGGTEEAGEEGASHDPASFYHARGTCKTIAIAVATSEPLRESVLFCDTGGLRLSQPGFCD